MTLEIEHKQLKKKSNFLKWCGYEINPNNTLGIKTSNL